MSTVKYICLLSFFVENLVFQGHRSPFPAVSEAEMRAQGTCNHVLPPHPTVQQSVVDTLREIASSRKPLTAHSSLA